MTDVEDVLVAALRLPLEARAAVAAELLESLDGRDEAEEDVEAAWSDEIRTASRGRRRRRCHPDPLAGSPAPPRRSRQRAS